MTAITAKQAADFCGGKLLGKSDEITYITTDSRAVKDKSLFAAIRGEKFDGHSFIKAY